MGGSGCSAGRFGYLHEVASGARDRGFRPVDSYRTVVCFSFGCSFFSSCFPFQDSRHYLVARETREHLRIIP